MKEPVVLLENVSPNENVVAVVEQDEAVCYFYLKGEDSDFGIKSCWVRNLDMAPEELDVASMRAGIPPRLPRCFCRHPAGLPPLVANNLKVVWSEEGDSAALTEGHELLAVIPLWSGRDGFSGYARDCLTENSLCWPLGTPTTNIQFDRFRRAAEYWESWSERDGPWPTYQQAACDAITRVLGPHSNYYGG